MEKKTGKVILVGAGPGNSGLLTIRGKEAIEMCDVIIYDSLANPSFLSYARADVEKIYVGKKGACHTLEQDAINRLLVEKANEGKTVVRLKGGDPYIFGRGSEEAEILAANGIEFEVVAGIPAAIGASATSGIPLTDRRYTSTLIFITGHEDPSKDESSIDWDNLARINATIVIYMGVKTLAAVASKLIERGKSSETPCAIVERATTPSQRIVIGKLGNIAEIANEKNIKPPSLTIIGDVIKLHDVLNWFDKRPLFGKTIAVTRSRAQASQLVKELTELGANVIEMPLIEIKPPQNWDEIDNAIANLDSFDWVIFTSPNGVNHFFHRMGEIGVDVRKFARSKVAAIGPATSQELKNRGIIPDFQPSKYISESIFEGLKEKGAIENKKFLLPRSDIAREDLAKLLRQSGADVSEIDAYRTVPSDFDVEMMKAMIEKNEIDAITFTSSSTANFFVDRLGIDFIRANGSKIKAVSIGPITSDALRSHGIEPIMEADEFSIPGLKRKMLEYLSNMESDKKLK